MAVHADAAPGAAACAAAVRERRVGARELAQQALDRIRARDPELLAFTYVDEDDFLAQADAVDAGRVTGPLAGVPVAVKDLIDVRGMPTSYGSAAFDPYRAERDAAVVARLREAGAVIAGKTRTAELAWSTTTPPTRNPRDGALVPGGSSGGSAAAVGAGLVPAALGTDTGGSVRIPAALCGIAGLRPTYGLVGRSGVLPGNWSFDAVGPLAGSAGDLRLLLAAMIGPDPGDRACAADARLAQVRERLERAAPVDLSRARIGLFDDPLAEMLDERGRVALDATIERARRAGAEVVTVRLPGSETIAPAFAAIDLGEGAAIHTERLRERGDAIDPVIRALLEVAHVIPAALVARAKHARRAVCDAVAELFTRERLDALVLPANPLPAVRADALDLAVPRANGELEPALWSYARVCWLASLTGQPALVLPMPEAGDPPLGIQLVGRPFHDDALLGLGRALEDIDPQEHA